MKKEKVPMPRYLRCWFFPKLERYQWDFERYASETDEVKLKVAACEYLGELAADDGSEPELPPWMLFKKKSPEYLQRAIGTILEFAEFHGRGDPECAAELNREAAQQIAKLTKEFKLSHDPQQFAGIRTANFYPALRALGVMRILHYFNWKAFLSQTPDAPKCFLNPRFDPYDERARALKFFRKLFGKELVPISHPTFASLTRSAKPRGGAPAGKIRVVFEDVAEP